MGEFMTCYKVIAAFHIVLWLIRDSHALQPDTGYLPTAGITFYYIKPRCGVTLSLPSVFQWSRGKGESVEVSEAGQGDNTVIIMSNIQSLHNKMDLLHA